MRRGERRRMALLPGCSHRLAALSQVTHLVREREVRSTSHPSSGESCRRASMESGANEESSQLAASGSKGGRKGKGSPPSSSTRRERERERERERVRV